MKKMICEVCGREFEAKRKAKICSTRCRSKKQYYKNKSRDEYMSIRRQAKSNSQLKSRIERKKSKEHQYSDNVITSHELDSRIFDVNRNQESHTCEECSAKFNYEFKTSIDENGSEYEHRFNTTEWGAPYCPRCGLVHSTKTVSAYDEVDQRREAELEKTRITMSKEDYYRRYSDIYDIPRQRRYKKQPKPGSMIYVEVRNGVGVYVKKQAIYVEDDEQVYDKIDFIQEGEVVRKMYLRTVKNKRKIDSVAVMSNDEWSTLIKYFLRQF